MSIGRVVVVTRGRFALQFIESPSGDDASDHPPRRPGHVRIVPAGIPVPQVIF
jgi:hypothetical protein